MKETVDIESLDQSARDEWLASFDVVLCDCDGETNFNSEFMITKPFPGVLWLHDYLFEGSNEFINSLVAMGKKVYLITNNNQTSREEMVIKCKTMNFNLELVRPNRSVIDSRYTSTIPF